jgi:hypothetical protein
MANISGIIQGAVQTIFKVVGDVAQPGTWVQQQAGFVNPSDGSFTATINNYTLPHCVIARYRIEDVDGKDITLKDAKLIFPRQDLPVEPMETDVFIDFNNKRWTVIRVQNDPAAAAVVCQIRTAARPGTMTPGV